MGMKVAAGVLFLIASSGAFASRPSLRGHGDSNLKTQDEHGTQQPYGQGFGTTSPYGMQGPGFGGQYGQNNYGMTTSPYGQGFGTTSPYGMQGPGFGGPYGMNNYTMTTSPY